MFFNNEYTKPHPRNEFRNLLPNTSRPSPYSTTLACAEEWRCSSAGTMFISGESVASNSTLLGDSINNIKNNIFFNLRYSNQVMEPLVYRIKKYYQVTPGR